MVSGGDRQIFGFHIFRSSFYPPLMNNPLFRPPAEADSLILQVDQGCPYNRCTFCGMYKDVPYRRLDIAEILSMIRFEARNHPEAKRVFLADGDVMRKPASELKTILLELKACLPVLARVNLYATGRGIASKSGPELEELRALKLNTLYMGLESGDEETLRQSLKGETAGLMTRAATLAQSSGLKMSVMVLLGLAGEGRSDRHADATAAALNAMQPRLLSMLRVVPIPGTRLFDDTVAGRFRMLSERAIVGELRRMVAGLDLANTVFRANHSSNIVPLEARFPRDKGELLATLDAMLTSGRLDSCSPGELPAWL